MTWVYVPRDEPTTHNRGGLSFAVPPATGNRLQRASWLEFGLWDHAFHSDGTLFNDAGEPDNVCGADSRRFFIALHDRTVTAATVEVAWKTVAYDGADLDGNGGAPTITLEGQGNGVYLSEALLLVADEEDRTVAVRSARAGSDRGAGVADHRLRRASMFGEVVATYPAGAPTHEARLPVFRRRPDFRKRFDLQIVVLDYATVTTSLREQADAARVLNDLQRARDTFERIGIWVQDVAPPPGGSLRSLPNGAAYTVLPAPRYTPALDWTDEAAIQLASDLPPLPPYTMRQTYVRALGGIPVGNSYPDSLYPSSPVRGHLFVASSGGAFTSAHEMGHLLLDLPTVDSHFSAPAAPPNRLRAENNLMFHEGAAFTDHRGRKRIWDAVYDTLYRWHDPVARRGPYTIPVNQYARMRQSRFLR